MASDNKWAGTTYGFGWMHRWLIKLLQVMDIRILYLFAAVFVVPVCLILRPSYGIIYRFFRKHFNQKPLKAFWNTYMNHVYFSQVVIDRFAMYADKKMEMEVEGYDNFKRLATKPEGFIQLSSHIGNYELAGYTLTAKDKMFNALVFGGEKATVMENRNKMFASRNIRMIPIKEDMSHLFAINDALQKGETMSIPADRIFGSKKCVRHTFLGEEASFPLGPFTVATTRSLDVLAVNVMKIAYNRYKIHVTPLDYDKTASRKQQIEQLSAAYVKELERMVRLYPTQWYNYYEFWN